MPQSVKEPKNERQPQSDSETRDRILQAATNLFARFGYEGTSLRMIAEESATQKGTLVYHFSSKENIRNQVLNIVLSHWKTVLPALLFAATTGENRFDRILLECVDFFREDPNRAKLLIRECLDQPDVVREQYAEQLEPWIDMLEETIAKGRKEGLIVTDMAPRIYIWLVVQMVLSTIAMSELAAGFIAPNQDTDATEQLTLELVRIARSSLFIDVN